MRPLALFVALTIVVAALGACGGDDGGGSAYRATTPVTELTGTQWALDTAALGVEGADAVSSWIRFERATVAGNDGCNQFSGPYESDGSKLTLGPLAGTQMACIGAADEVSRRVTSSLTGVASYDVSGTTLRLRDSAGEVVLTYRAS